MAQSATIQALKLRRRKIDEALEELYSYTGVSKERTAEELNDIMDELMIKREALKD